MTWQEELTQLITCGWEPVFNGGRFAVQSHYKSFVVTLTPPQGIYGVWFVDVRVYHPVKKSVSFSGKSAFELLERIYKT